MRNTNQTIHALGYAGLIPFVVPAIALAMDIDHALLSQSIVDAYAFGIISFLCGSWWGMELPRNRRAALVLSNLLFLVAFFVFAIATEWWSLSACLLLITLFLVEFSGSIVPFASIAYRRMRAILTLAAAGSMLVVHLAR